MNKLNRKILYRFYNFCDNYMAKLKIGGFCTAKSWDVCSKCDNEKFGRSARTGVVHEQRARVEALLFVAVRYSLLAQLEHVFHNLATRNVCSCFIYIYTHNCFKLTFP